ncbi:DNA translocase FtsK [Paenibacillus sp. J2TS4]|uniref:FtsK/SpoIIIE family DNA translocase n=1 Tax=Paenibacillus sp. J2TS4 TaxID=2807194 RepID=UPI001B1BCC32|nr:DNA translocase FtsK [Paenibacillus sp. J2TS4]GIP33131.1 DNA translocase SpoIIIE [Paenibacillus sp. J2TS4]
MAKKRKKNAGMKLAIKYELYGIAILILSVIALSRQGSVARALTYLFRFMIGVLDFVIPLIFIYIAVFVMINRAWPRKWSSKKTGLVLILAGLIIMNHMSMMKIIDPLGDTLKSSYIVSETWERMTDGLRAGEDSPGILNREVGGGMVGAFLYAALYLLFGIWGSKLIVYALFASGILLVTGISVVDLFKGINKYFKNGRARLGKGLASLFSRPKRKLVHKQVPSSKKLKKQPSAQIYDPDEEEAYGEEALPEAPYEPKNEKKKPVFVQLLGSKKVARDEQEPINLTEQLLDEDRQQEEAIPIIRDFRDEIEKSESSPRKPAAPEMEEDPGEEELAFGNDPDKTPDKPYQLPDFGLLSKPVGMGKGSDHMDYKANARKLEATLESFGVRAKVLDVVRGPSVTRYEIQPDVGVKVSRIVGLTDDIALALAAKDIRMEAPIPGKSAIGIEVPNTEVSMVTLREVMESSVFYEADAKLSISLGRDITGQPIVANLAKMPHLLVAGATGSGKSVCINGIITSVLFKAKPDEVKFLMIDPKMVELNVYNGIPHLLAPVVTDPRRASLALKKVVVEMEKRYELFSKSGTRNIEGYNAMITDKNNPNPGDPLPLIVVIVDELADLMMVAANDVEDAICRLAQMARAAGIHLIIATQRPSVDVITGLIKANIPSRIAFGVSSQVDSRTILDMAGAEKLLGRGDMLFMPVGATKPLRVQGAFLSDQEVEAVVTFCRSQEQAEYREELVPEIDEQPEQEDVFEDELFDQAVQIILEAKQASVSLLQRRMRVGYTRAARLIDSMEAKGIVGPYEGSKPREVLLTLEQFQQSRISS